MEGLLLSLGIIVFFLVCLRIAFFHKDIPLLICTVAVFALLLSFTFLLTRNEIYQNFAKGVSLDLIPAKGEYHSVAQIEIIYRESDLAEVVLVGGTTRPKK